jgi:hypothetical protein
MNNGPDTYLSFLPCEWCLQKPCEHLRFGGVRPGKPRIIHHAEFRPTTAGCPFNVLEPREFDMLLDDLPEYDLGRCVEDALIAMSPMERLACDLNQYLHSPNDAAGKAAFLHALWDRGIIAMLRIPTFYASDTAMAKWLLAFQNPAPLFNPFKKQKKQDDAALTDDMAATSTDFTIQNARWEHVDESKRTNTPDKAAFGDEVRLLVDISGVPDGAGMRFDLFDTASDRPTRPIASVNGRVASPTTAAQWTVTDPRKLNDTHEVKLEFEGVVRDRQSGRAGIALKMVFTVLLQIDVDDPKAKDDELILYDDQNGEVARVKVGAMTEIAEDMVRLIFENIDMKKKYTLIRDYGPDENGGHDPLFVEMTPEELMEMSNAA